VAAEGGHFVGWLPAEGSASAERLVDADVRIRGVCGALVNNRRQSIGVRLFIPTLASIQVRRPAPADPFALPARQVKALLGFNPDGRPGHRVKTAGVVTWCRGRRLYLTDETGGIGVTLAAPWDARPGDRWRWLTGQAAAAAQPGLRVLYMTGYTDDAVLRHGLRSAGVPLLEKPFTQDALAHKVREVLEAAPAQTS
jgi:hypothetical protein